MIKNIKEITERGNKSNEDFIASAPNYILVIDGSSSLNDVNAMGEINDALWFSHGLGERLVNKLPVLTLSIKEIVKSAIADLACEFNAKACLPDIKKYIYPSASICVFRINQEKLEYFQLGDCTATVKFKSGDFQVLHDDTVTRLDSDVVKEMVAIAQQRNISIKDTIEIVRPLLIENRQKKNTLGGYWIIDISGEGIDYAFTKDFCVSEIENISLMSDGFADVCGNYKMFKDFQSLNDSIECNGVKNIVSSLFEMQNSDSDFNKYPRLKFRDDTSVVWGEIEN